MPIIIAIFVLTIWTTYRLFFKENLLFDELLLKPLIWLFPIFFYVKFNFKSLGFSQKNIVKNVFIGLTVGLILSLERIYLKSLTPNFSWIIIVSALFTATTEEVFFRGFLLNSWLKFFKNPIVAMILNGLFFTLFHVPIAIFVFHYYGYNLFTYLLLNFVSGFVDIILFTYTKSIYPSISNHFVWNIFSGIFK